MNHHIINLSMVLMTLSLTASGQGPAPASHASETGPAQAIDVPAEIQSHAGGFTSQELQKTQFILPEGNMIIDRKCKLARHEDGRWFLVMTPGKPTPVKARVTTESSSRQTAGPLTNDSPSDPSGKSLKESEQFTVPIEILPNKWLTSMTRVCGEKVNLEITFRIWGEVTVYEKRNFILISLVATGSTFGEPPTGSTVKPVSKLDAMLNNNTSEIVENQPEKKEEQRQKLMLAENLRNILLNVPRPHILEARPENANGPEQNNSTTKNPDVTASSGNQTTEMSKWKDGDWMPNRLGYLRFNANDKCYEFVFLSSTTSTPIIVHPCKALEEMKMKIDRTSRAIKFKISGRKSTYKNNFYILPKTQMETTSRGNLGR
ncbi:MAG: hypothetical protein K9M57_09835 [Phycisphaerae bacterium]|nr:hypothetical protein [Phycisphaerae bacterium]